MNQEQVSAEPMGELGRLGGVLFDPKLAFADIAARPVRWWVPLLLLGLIAAAFTAAFAERVGWERFFNQQWQQAAARDERLSRMSAEQKEQIIRQQATVTKWAAPAIAVVEFGVLALGLAGVFLFVFNILAGSQLTFRPVFAITSYSLLPYAVAMLLAMGLMFVQAPEEFDLVNPVMSNLGVFFDPVESPVVFALTKSLDVFTVWALLLLATGFSAAGRRLSWGKAMTWVVITWVLFVVGKVGWVALWT